MFVRLVRAARRSTELSGRKESSVSGARIGERGHHGLRPREMAKASTAAINKDARDAGRSENKSVGKEREWRWNEFALAP